MLTPEEIENLSQMLLSNNPDTKELALELLKNYPDYVADFQIEIELSIFVYEEYPLWVGLFRDFYKEHFGVEQLRKIGKQLVVFRRVPSRYTKEATETVRQMVLKFEEVRAVYEPYICKNRECNNKYITLAQQIAQYFPYETTAEPYFRWIIAHNPTIDNYIKYGDYLQVRGDSAAAKTVYEKVLSLDVNTIEVGLRLGKLLLDEKQYEQAILVLKQAAENNYGIEKTKCLSALATAYRFDGKTPKAIIEETFKQAFANYQNCWEVCLAWGDFLKAEGSKPKHVYKAYKNAVHHARYQHKEPYLVLAAFCMFEYDKIEEAYELLQQILVWQEDNDTCALFYITILLSQHQPEENMPLACRYYLQYLRQLKNNYRTENLHRITHAHRAAFDEAKRKILQWKGRV